MANKLALGLVIGGAVSSTVGSAFKEVEGRIKKLEAAGAKARVMQRQIGDTIRLRNEWKKAHDTGAAGASTLLNKLNANLDSLRKQGIEVGRLDKAYQALGRAAQQADLKAKGHTQINQGRATVKSSIGKAAVGVAALAVPTKVSADYNAIIRDIAIKAGVANAPQEQQMSRTIISTSRDTGLARNEVANVVNELVPGAVNMGDVVRSFANATPPAPLVMPPKVEPVLKVEPPKINQKIDVNAALSVTVQGDVKDPAALARELQPHLQRQIEQINQQMSNRNLYDEPHL